MKKVAYALTLIFLMVPLAGCSGTDAEVKVDLSNEEINDIIDENIEDVMNNTTVVVFQEYHNNTTVVNHYSTNTTNSIDQTGTTTTTYNYNGSNTQSEMRIVRLDWDYTEYTEETPKRDRNFTVNYSYYDYATNDDRTDSFTLPCWNYYDATNPNTNQPVSWNFWQDDDYFYDWWDYLYNNTIRDLLGDVAYYNSVRNTCLEETGGFIINDDEYRTYDSQIGDIYDYSTAPVFFEMSVPNGTMLKVVQLRASHEYTNSDGYDVTSSFDWTLNEESDLRGSDNARWTDYCPLVYWHFQYTDSDYWAQCGSWFGGWQDFDLRFNMVSSVYEDSVFSFTMVYELQTVSSHS